MFINDADILRNYYTPIYSRRVYEEFRIEDVNYFTTDPILKRKIFMRLGNKVKRLYMKNGETHLPSIPFFLGLFRNVTTLSVCDLSPKYSSDEFDRMPPCHETFTMPHLKTLEVKNCHYVDQVILKYLRGATITEGSFSHVRQYYLLPFLREHETSLKKLTLKCPIDAHSLLRSVSKLKNLKLDYLDYCTVESSHILGNDEDFMNFLKQNSKMKFLGIRGGILVEDKLLNGILNYLEHLETLIIEFGTWRATYSTIDKLNKLKNLKKLSISSVSGNYEIRNLLNGLRFGNFQNLVEIEAPFVITEEDFLVVLKSRIPNLKRLSLVSYSNSVVEFFLKRFKQLEHLTIFVKDDYYGREPLDLDQKVLLQLKSLHIKKFNLPLDSKFARKLVNNFPNLQNLQIDYCDGIAKRALKILLRHMKQLKKLTLSLDAEEILFGVKKNYKKAFKNAKILKKKFGNLRKFKITKTDKIYQLELKHVSVD